MAKRSAETEEQKAEREAAEAEQHQEQQYEEPTQEFLNLINEVGTEEHSISIYRQNKQGKYAFLGKWTSTEFSMDAFSRQYGGGKYRGYLQAPNGQAVGSKVFEIDAAVKPQEEAQTHVPATPVSPPGADPALLDLIKEGRTEQNRLTEAIITALSNKPQGTDMVAIMTALAPVLAAVVSRPQPAAEDPTKYIGLMMDGIKLGQGMKEGEGGGAKTFWEGIVEKVVEKVVPILAQRAGMPTAPAPDAAPKLLTAPPLTTPANGASATKPAEAPPPKETTVDAPYKDHPMVKFYAPTIITEAEKKTDPTEFAKNLIIRLDAICPEGWHLFALDICAKPDVVEFLTQYDARVDQHKEWFAASVTQIKRLIEESMKAQLAEDKEPEPEEANA